VDSEGEQLQEGDWKECRESDNKDDNVEEEEMELEEVFKKLDSDNSGYLNQFEVANAISLFTGGWALDPWLVR
jgi:Ca2+-binding EF-hand superfamily protein